jgi:hypothetical protein
MLLYPNACVSAVQETGQFLSTAKEKKSELKLRDENTQASLGNIGVKFLTLQVYYTNTLQNSLGSENVSFISILSTLHLLARSLQQ